MHPQRLGAVDCLHHYPSTGCFPPWRPRHRCPLLIPTAGAGIFGQVVKLCVGTQSSCSADSFSTRPGVFLDLGLFRVSTPLRGPPPPVRGVEVKCPLIPAGDSFYSRGVAQHLKPPRKFVPSESRHHHYMLSGRYCSGRQPATCE